MNALDESMPKAGRPGLASWLFNPFVYVAGGPALAIGLALILVSGLVGYLSNSHFDGVLDFHSGLRAPLLLVLSEGYISWLALAIPLFFAGKLISRSKFRAIDLFGTQAMARWPAILSAVVALLPPVHRVTQYLVSQATKKGPEVAVSQVDGAIFVAALLVMVVGLCWMVWLMYRSFSISCNVSGWKAVVVFIMAVLVGEVLSKIAIIALLKGFIPAA